MQLIGQQKGHNPNDVIYNFSLPPKSLKFDEYLLPWELLYRGIHKDDKVNNENLVHLKAKLRDTSLSSYRAYNSKNHRYENLSREEFEALLKLVSSNDIIIQKGDKGNTVVILDKTTYIEKMESLLSDQSKFTKVNFDRKYKVNKKRYHWTP